MLTEPEFRASVARLRALLDDAYSNGEIPEGTYRLADAELAQIETTDEGSCLNPGASLILSHAIREVIRKLFEE